MLETLDICILGKSLIVIVHVWVFLSGGMSMHHMYACCLQRQNTELYFLELVTDNYKLPCGY